MGFRFRRRWIRWIIPALVLIAILIQFLPVARTNPPVKAAFDGPIAVREIFQRSCYDCHSNQTEWPWYSRVAPASWLVADHVYEGREELNFSDWPAYDDAHTREEIVEVTTEGEMPLPSYLWIHHRAKLSPDDLAVLRQWAGISAGSGGEEKDHDSDSG